MHPTAEGEACNECESCRAFNEQRSYNIFELDAASNNSVENIKSLMDQTRIPPQVGRYKVFIIDEVHMLSTAAFNAFLKTLEEPPAHVIFILATTEKHKILPTIISRCQIYDFERMTVQNTIDHLKMVAEKEGITYEEEALALIAEKADGGMRDALSIFDQAASYSQGNITYQKIIEDLNELDSDNYFRITDLAFENKVTDIMMLLNSIIAKGFDGGNLITGLAAHMRNVLMAKDNQTVTLLEVSEKQRQKYVEQAAKCPVKFLYKALKIMNECDINYRQSSNKRLLVELTLIQVAQITQPDDDTPGAGRSPKRLKSLFKNIVMSRPKAAQQVAVAGKKLSYKTERTAEAATIASEPTAQESVKPNPMTKKLKLDNIGITFAGIKKAETEIKAVKEPEVKNKDENETFDQDFLELQWLSMCKRMPPKMVGLASRMRNMTPRITRHPNIELTVDNQNLLDQVNEIKGRIRATLAEALHNGNIQIELKLAKAEEVGPMLTPKEMFDEMRKKNPIVDKMCATLNLELA